MTPTPNPDFDLVLRQQVLAALSRRWQRRLAFEGNVRAGTVVYIDGERQIRFWHEMGGGDCKLYINLPAEAQWAAATGTPLSERDEIVRFVAERVQQEKASGWRYEISAAAIEFY